MGSLIASFCLSHCTKKESVNYHFFLEKVSPKRGCCCICYPKTFQIIQFLTSYLAQLEVIRWKIHLNWSHTGGFSCSLPLHVSQIQSSSWTSKGSFINAITFYSLLWPCATDSMQGPISPTLHNATDNAQKRWNYISPIIAIWTKETYLIKFIKFSEVNKKCQIYTMV